MTSGTRGVDWVYVQDVVNAYLRAAVTPGIEGKTIDVGTGKLTTVRQIVEQLYAIIAPDMRRFNIWDFGQWENLVAAGRAAAELALPQLQQDLEDEG